MNIYDMNIEKSQGIFQQNKNPRINEFSKVAGYKTTTHKKSILFLYTKYIEKKKRKKKIHYIHSKENAT